MNRKLFKIIFIGLWTFGFGLWTLFSVQAGIVIKIIGVNPSKEETKKVVLKAYLPKEIKPADVIYKDDLQIVYDPQQGSYYAYGEYQLEPGGIIEKEVEMADVWVIADREIESLRLEIVQTFKLLENTDFKERASFLKESVERKLNTIIERQRVSAANPQNHISDYRENLKYIEAVKEDLGLARGFLAQAKPFSSVAVWKLFFIIVGFLGFLGLALYFVWQKQASVVRASSVGAVREPPEEEVIPRQRRKTEERDVEAEDIEKIMGNDE